MFLQLAFEAVAAELGSHLQNNVVSRRHLSNAHRMLHTIAWCHLNGHANVMILAILFIFLSVEDALKDILHWTIVPLGLDCGLRCTQLRQ